MDKPELGMAYEKFLEDAGINSVPPEDRDYEPYLRETHEWLEDVSLALKDEPELLGYFLGDEWGGETEALIAAFKDNTEMMYALNRAYEQVITRAESFPSHPYAVSTLKYLNFQLDAQAATAFGEFILKDKTKYSWNLSDPTVGVLAQKNLPTELADKILMRYFKNYEVPLPKWRYSEETLRLFIDTEKGEDLVPFVRMSNPYLTDGQFEELLEKHSHRLGESKILSYIELSTKRWLTIIDKCVSTWYTEITIAKDIAKNPTLPKEVARILNKKFKAPLYFEGENVELHFTKKSWLLDKRNAYFVSAKLTTSEQLERLFAITGVKSHEGILRNPAASPNLIDKVLAADDVKREDYKQYIRFDYDEPNIWSIAAEAPDYFKYGPRYKARFEAKMKEVFERDGYSEFLSSPLSWQARMAELIVEEKRAVLAKGLSIAL